MSELRTNTLSNVAGTGPVVLTGQSAAKAWANLDGTGTIVLRDDFNVASVTDNGIGDYTYAFASIMSNANYCQVGGGSNVISGQNPFAHTMSGSQSISTGNVRMKHGLPNGSTASEFVADVTLATLTVHGDLA